MGRGVAEVGHLCSDVADLGVSKLKVGLRSWVKSPAESLQTRKPGGVL